jgi:HrpA-like RNA helicase
VFFQCSGHAGDHFTLREVYMQWADSGFDRAWCADHFVQFRSLSRAREVRDQLVNLCEGVEIEVIDIPWGGGKFAAEKDPIAAHRDALAMCITRGYFPHASRLGKSGQVSVLQCLFLLFAKKKRKKKKNLKLKLKLKLTHFLKKK